MIELKKSYVNLQIEIWLDARPDSQNCQWKAWEPQEHKFVFDCLANLCEAEHHLFHQKSVHPDLNAYTPRSYQHGFYKQIHIISTSLDRLFLHLICMHMEKDTEIWIKSLKFFLRLQFVRDNSHSGQTSNKNHGRA